MVIFICTQSFDISYILFKNFEYYGDDKKLFLTGAKFNREDT
jgi:hypothetical protein